MSLPGYVLLVLAAVLGGLVVWSYVREASAHWNPPNPRYCHERRCIRLAQHPGSHVDDSGRTWL